MCREAEPVGDRGFLSLLLFPSSSACVPWTPRSSAGPLRGRQEAGVEPSSVSFTWRPLGLSSLSEDREGVSTSVCRVLKQLLVSQR